MRPAVIDCFFGCIHIATMFVLLLLFSRRVWKLLLCHAASTYLYTCHIRKSSSSFACVYACERVCSFVIFVCWFYSTFLLPVLFIPLVAVSTLVILFYCCYMYLEFCQICCFSISPRIQSKLLSVSPSAPLWLFVVGSLDLCLRLNFQAQRHCHTASCVCFFFIVVCLIGVSCVYNLLLGFIDFDCCCLLCLVPFLPRIHLLFCSRHSFALSFVLVISQSLTPSSYIY